MICVDRDVRVGEVDLESESPFAHVGQGLRHRIARQQPLRLELLAHPGEEPFGDRLGMHQSIVEFLRGAELVLADVRFDRVEATDEVQALRRDVRLDILRLEQVAPRVSPALRVGPPGLLRVVLIGGIAVAEQDAALDWRQAQRLLDMFDAATLEEREADFVELAMTGQK
ncbi:hypothetical protein SDC9_101268 [bioreactor metagenome]|uniref:Uncharacterized protein n=1 Tax=bioreactor metagenome TaxID=1076179 RepID=A0A645AMZ7_9ZZZZ